MIHSFAIAGIFVSSLLGIANILISFQAKQSITDNNEYNDFHWVCFFMLAVSVILTYLF